MFASTTKDNKTNAAKDGMINEGGHPMDDIKETARHFKGEAHDAAAAIKDDLEGVARRTGQHARELADTAGHSISAVGDTMLLKIRNNPVQSSLIALAVGLVAGMIARRR